MARRIAAALLALTLFAGAASASDTASRYGELVAGATVGDVLGYGSGGVVPLLGLPVPGVGLFVPIGCVVEYLLMD